MSRRAVAPSHRRLIVVLGALSAMAPLSMDLYLPGLPRLTGDLGTSDALAQLTLTTCLIGLAVGQLISGPISDARGRSGPLRAGLAVYVAASALCALSPSIGVLIALRAVQGLAGAAGIVLARAIVRDLWDGAEAARTFSLMVLVNGMAPILAPLLGGGLLKVTDWRGVFLVLAVVGAVLLAASVRTIAESLPAERRHTGGLRMTSAAFGRLLGDRAFLGYALASGASFAAMFAYIAGSPFVLQDVYGLSPQLFGLVFGVNALGIVLAARIGAARLDRDGPRRLLTAGLVTSATGGTLLLVATLAGAGLAGTLPALFLVVASIGLSFPNATALAMEDHKASAGSASALLGVAQYLLGALAAPLVGLGGQGTATPMAVVVCVFSLAGVACLLTLVPARPGVAAPAL